MIPICTGLIEACSIPSTETLAVINPRGAWVIKQSTEPNEVWSDEPINGNPSFDDLTVQIPAGNRVTRILLGFPLKNRPKKAKSVPREDIGDWIGYLRL